MDNQLCIQPIYIGSSIAPTPSRCFNMPLEKEDKDKDKKQKAMPNPSIYIIPCLYIINPSTVV